MRTSATTKAPTSTTAAYPRLPKTYFFSNPPLMYTTANYYYQCRTVDPPVAALDGPASKTFDHKKDNESTAVMKIRNNRTKPK